MNIVVKKFFTFGKVIKIVISGYHPNMTNNHPSNHAKGTVWTSVEKLMVSQWGRSNISRLARESGMGLATISRLQDDQTTSIGLDKVEKLAAVFNQEPWKLLDPDFDPDVATESLSPKAKELARAFDAIADPSAKARAYAMCLQLLDFANPPLAQSNFPGDGTKFEPPAPL